MVKVTRAVARNWLSDVPEDKRFWCGDGRMLKNLPELNAALREMAEVTFRYHVTEAKNDFSSWVKDVIGDEELANALRKSTTPARAAQTVADRINWLKKR